VFITIGARHRATWGLLEPGSQSDHQKLSGLANLGLVNGMLVTVYKPLDLS